MKPPSKLVGVFGSSRIGPNKFLFSQAYQAGFTLVNEGWTIVTGGGEGLSSAVAHGGTDAAERYFGNQDDSDDYPFVGPFALAQRIH